ncbi:MAG: hypothetical protein AB7I48_01045 [Planctomycetaceae bacterium]
MRLARLASLASIGLCLSSGAGCYSPYQYSSPYGSPYGYPGAPVQTLTPGGTYAPGMPQGTYGTPAPSGSFSQPTPSGNSTYQPGSSQSGSQFYENSSAPPYNGSGGVPTYPDAGEVKFQQSKPKPIAEDPGLFEQGSLDGVGASIANVAKVTVDNAEFLEPVRVEPQEPQPTLADAALAVPGSPSPYAHDAEGYRWLRGLARRNEATGVWSLVYSNVQIDADPFHGWLTLAPDPRLAELQPDRAYLISGELDQTQTDTAGKPLYRIQSVTAWAPSTTF